METPLVTSVQAKLNSGKANLAAQARAGIHTNSGVPSKLRRLDAVPSDQPYLNQCYSVAAIGGAPTHFAGAPTINEA